MRYNGFPILKVVVGGPYHSGKTTTIRSLDPNATCLERKQADGKTTTVGFDVGKLVLCNHNGTDCILSQQDFDMKKDELIEYDQVTTLLLFGCAGQMRFKDVRKATLRGAKGVLFVVDSTNPGHIGHCVALFEEIRIILGEDIPLVVLANKQDLPESLNADKINELLSIEGIPIFETSALTGVGITKALLKLVHLITRKEADSDKELRNLSLI
ncbi:MAG: ATP/GTP-binding protein [Promethearchaeota archaeon]